MAEPTTHAPARADEAAPSRFPLDLTAAMRRRTTAPEPTPPPAVRFQHSWRRTYAFAVAGADAAVLAVSGALAYALRFGQQDSSVSGVSYVLVTAGAVAAWLLFLTAGRAYEERFLGTGATEFRQVTNASIRFVAAVALACYALKVDLSRGYVVLLLLLGCGALVLSRSLGHVALRLLRARGHCLSRVLVAGDRSRVADMVAQLERERGAGLHVVGVCTPLGEVGTQVGMSTVVGSLTRVTDLVREHDADAIVVTASPGITSTTLRRLAWELEGTGVSLLVAPGLTDVAGPRISVRPVGSRLPLLHVEEPEFSGARRVLKGTEDRLVAFLGLVLLSPLLLVLALAVRLDSRGPAIFRQTRIGRCGEQFTLWKFRSMHVDAEERLAALAADNESDGLLFKMRDDPRVTRVGRLLRTYSLDELPQLFNVLAGSMSLVGPRPPLAREVEQYGHDVRRRLLVKPGITGLWQISGRSDLSWEDSVRLDLYYVENWSLLLDVQILVGTARAVVKGSGAY